ncbi:MAG: prolyl oligopeptidase family serine peptidase [Steroidobacteraceae bacterium]
MRRIVWPTLLGLVITWPAVGHNEIPLTAFAGEPAMRAARLSPNGQRLVYITTTKDGDPTVVTVDFGTKAAHSVVAGRIKQFDVDHCNFKTNDRLLCFFYGTVFDLGRPYWTSRLVAVDFTGENLKVLVQNGRAGEAQFQDRIVHWLPDNPRDVLIELDDDGNIYPSVFKLDVYNGRMKLVLRERQPITSWMADRKGEVRFGFGYKDERGLYIAREAAGERWITLARFNAFDGHDFSPMGFGADPDRLLVIADFNGRRGIFETDLTDQSNMQPVFGRPDVDVDTSIEWTRDQGVLGFAFEADKPGANYIDGWARSVQRAVDGALPKTVNTIVNASDDRKSMLIRSTSDVDPGVYYKIDITSGQLVKLADTHPLLSGARLAPMQPINVDTGKGWRLPGYLTVPVGREPRNLPLVVLPHGGPYSRDTWGFDPLVQVLASRGYAVLQVNFRGSTGFGYAFEAAGDQAWSTIMHDDITAAARWAIAQGIADPKRMCIVGWSYGGFAALVASYKEAGLYQCAVSIAGVSAMDDWAWQNKRFYAGRKASVDSTGQAALRERSPVDEAGRIGIPILLVHGTADVNVVVDHSKKMAAALRRANKPYDLLLIPDGDHSLGRAEWRLALYEKMTAFLATHVPVQ